MSHARGQRDVARAGAASGALWLATLYGVCLLLAAAAAVLAGGLTEDLPVVAMPKSGDITGKLAPADKITEVSLVSRDTGKTYKPKSFDRKTGQFVFAALPGDATYDICLTADGGRKIEGIDLGFADERMLRLADLRRKQLGLATERQEKFSDEDAAALVKFVAETKDFCDVRRVLYIRGHGRRATMLVEVMRTREYYAQKGAELIWRTELWYFENNYGGWDRVANQEKVLRRERIGRATWDKISLEYYPQLSVHIDASGASAPVEFTVPDKPDISRGRVPSTEPEVKTKPYIDGVDKPTSQPASAEASAEKQN